MSVKADFESLKQQILEVVTKDPDVRYILMGWMTEEFVPKTDYSKILDELRDLRERSDQRWAENDKYWKEANQRFNALQQEIKDLREDSNRRFEEAAAERQKAAADRQAIREEMSQRFEEAAADRQKAATDRQAIREEMSQRFEEAAADRQNIREDMIKGFQRQFKILNAKIDRLGGRWGIRAETAFRDGMSSILQDFFDGQVTKWETQDTEGVVYGHDCRVELDIVLSNGKCIVGEIKSQVIRAEVAAFHRIVGLYEKQTGIRPDRKVLIVADIDTPAKELAQKLAIEVFTMDEFEPE